MTKKTKVAIIGCGKQAPKHIAGLKTVPEVEIAVADINVELAKTLADSEDIQSYGDVESVYDDADVDAVVICTPTPTHLNLIESAISTNKSFLCEKPLCESIADAKNIAKLLADTTLTGMVGYIYRYSPVFEMGKNLTQDVPKMGNSMVMGDIAMANLRLGGRGSHKLWKHRKEDGGGAINEMLVHMVDLAIWYFGGVENVSVLGCNTLRPVREIEGVMHEVSAEDYILVELTMKNNIKVICQADLVTPAFTQLMEIQGTNATFIGSIQADMPNFLFCSNEVSGYSAGMNKFDFGKRNLFSAQTADFINSIRIGSQPPRSTIEDTIVLMETMNQIKQQVTI